MLDLYKLHIFETIVREGSFTAAAARLYMTQAAVSQHVAELEAALGVRLFDRGRRGVTLTPEGELLSRYAKQILALVREAENAVTQVGQLAAGQVIIGATPGVSAYQVPDWMQAFRERFPRLTVTLHTGTTPQIVDYVLAQKVELGVVEGELDMAVARRLLSIRLEDVEQYVIVGAHHAWWDQAAVPIAALADQAFIMRPASSQSRLWLNEVLKAHGIAPRLAAEFDNLESIKRAVATGTCISILPRYVVEDAIHQGTLRALPLEPPQRRTLHLLLLRELPLAPVARAFVQSLAECFPTLNMMFSS